MNRIALRLKSVLMLCVALVCELMPHRRTQTTKSIAVVQMAKLGDMVCTTPMFRAIKERHPKARLTVVGNAINEEVLRGNPYVDQYIVYDGSFIKTIRTFQACHFDAVCITGPSFELLASSIAARIPLTVVPRIEGGWSPYETRLYKLLRMFVTTVPHRMGSYAPREYLRLLEPLGIETSDTRKEVYFVKAALERPKKMLHGEVSSDTNIGILPGAGNEIKSWPPEHFAALMNMISSHDTAVRFVLLGSPKDAPRAQAIINSLNQKESTINCLGAFSIEELKACVSMLTMVIGADTGPQYIAEALNIPTIDIVGPVDEREQPPTGPLHRIVKVERAKPELYVMNARVYDKTEAVRQTRGITPEMVYEEYGELMRTLKTNER